MRTVTDLNSLFVNRVMVVMMPIMMYHERCDAPDHLVGAQQVAASAMQVGDMMAFMQYGIKSCLPS